MAELTTIARPYADAAFTYAREAQGLDAWSSALAFLGAVARDPNAQDLLQNPEIDNAVKLGFLKDVAQGALDPHMENFVALLLENDRLELLPEIAVLFEEKKQALEGKIEVLVRSAVSLGDAQLKAVKDGLKRRFRREVVMETQVDPALIGGMWIKAGDTVIDGTVRGQLEQLGNTLRS